MRSFVAIDLPDPVRDALAQVQAGLRVGRHVPAENLHLTLAFLDDQSETTLHAFHEALAGRDFPQFQLQLAGLELFGGKRPRLLYMKADGGSALTQLHHQIRRIAQDVEIDLPRERFRPHVTLARFRRDMMEEQAAILGRFLELQADVALPSFAVEKICLFGSTLHPDGAVHEVLAEYPLT